MPPNPLATELQSGAETQRVMSSVVLASLTPFCFVLLQAFTKIDKKWNDMKKVEAIMATFLCVFSLFYCFFNSSSSSFMPFSSPKCKWSLINYCVLERANPSFFSDTLDKWLCAYAYSAHRLNFLPAQNKKQNHAMLMI